MKTFKKTLIAVATIATVAGAAAAPAHAGQWWEKPLVQGLGMGVGAGIGYGVTQRILNPRPSTVIVQQPAYQPTCRNVATYNQYGQFVGYTC